MALSMRGSIASDLLREVHSLAPNRMDGHVRVTLFAVALIAISVLQAPTALTGESSKELGDVVTSFVVTAFWEPALFSDASWVRWMIAAGCLVSFVLLLPL